MSQNEFNVGEGGSSSNYKVTFRDKLYHGVNVIVEIIWDTNVQDNSGNKQVAFAKKVEFNKFIDIATKTWIGMLGEPGINVPKTAEYFGTIKKLTTDHPYFFDGRGKSSFFTDTMLNYKVLNDNALPTGILDKFDLVVYAYTPSGERLVTRAKNCTLSSFKRSVDSQEYMMDEFSFKFKRFTQEFY